MPSFSQPLPTFRIFFLMLITLGMLFLAAGIPTFIPPQPSSGIQENPVPKSCTIFTVTSGDAVYFGNNEDYRLWGTYAWFIPAQDISISQGTRRIHGAVFFGFDNNEDPADGYPQGGMNDQGLCCDGNGLPYHPLNHNQGTTHAYAPHMAQILWECSTVEEVIDWYQTHYIGNTMNYQMHFADATGDAVVISPDTDNELAFTRIGPSGYLVSTNFNLADHTHGYFPCWRYNTATQMLASMMYLEDVTIESCRDVLDAVHNDGEYATKYSNIFDLVSRQISLYYDRKFADPITLNLDAQLAQVHPGTPDYTLAASVFGVIGVNGHVHYKQIEIASLFNVPPPLLPLLPVGLTFGAAAMLIVVIYLKKRHTP